MVENVISFVGAFLKHVIGVVMLCWRRMLRAGVIAFGIGVVLVLLVAVISTGQAYPGALAFVVALIFGAALAYGVALTVFVEEFLLGIVDLIRLLEGDVKAAAHITATVAEREAGDVTQGLRRLIGLPVSSHVRRARASAAALPPLPPLPKYPATPPRPAATSARPASQAIDVAAVAGAAALAAAAATRGAMPAATPPPATPSPAPAEPPAAPLDEGHDITTPVGEPVRADRLPRIGWTYEHEAIRPTRVAASLAEPTADAPVESDTLAELAGAASVAGMVASASHQAAPGAAEAPSEPPVVVAPAPTEATPASEPLDVTVVSATPLGGFGAVAPASALDDVSPLEDERLAEPVALSLPADEPATPPAEAAPIENAPRLDPAMLAPAPATIPLAPEAPPLDPAMLAPAPATTPLPQDEAPQPVESAPPMEETRADVAPVDATPVEAETPTLPEIPLAAAPVGPAPQAEPEPPVDEEPAPPARSAFSRITRPIEDLGSALDAISRTRTQTGPRASAPESGLWERLSQALIDRSGMPSNPFAAPQSARPTPPESPETSAESGPDGTPQA